MKYVNKFLGEIHKHKGHLIMSLAGQRSHIKEHARHIKSRNWRITVTNYRSFSKNLVSKVKQATYLKAPVRSSSSFKC